MLQLLEQTEKVYEKNFSKKKKLGSKLSIYQKEKLKFSHSHQPSLWFGDFREVLAFLCGS